MSNGMQSAALLGNSLAGATLNSHGDFTWRTQRAREWLEIYQRECGIGAQARVQDWIARVASGNQECNQNGSRICLSRPGASLHIHLVGKTEKGEYLMLLEEYRRPDNFSAAADSAASSADPSVAKSRRWPRLSAAMSVIWAFMPALKKA